MKTKKVNWDRFARACAEDAHVNWFPTRRGAWYINDLDAVVVFNNHPYEDQPALRDEEVAEFRRRLAAEGIEELAFATYPEDGYSYAMVLDASFDRLLYLENLMTGIVTKTVLRAMKGSPA